MPLPNGSTFAGYTIIRPLGSGAMGEVYIAKHPRLPREDALKVLSPAVPIDHEYRLRFEREADMVAGLWHPHIVGIHDRGEYDGKLWIAMDYVDGTDAGELAARQPGGLPPAQVVRIIGAVAEALDYAHARHLLHRDVKPSNILVTRDAPDAQRILLADFGIARRDDETEGLTATNMTVGTVTYAAPEQLMGKQLDGRADQYALAATAYHLLTGAPPFHNSNQAVIISQHLTAAPPPLGERRPDLAHLGPALSKALSKDPADRYARCMDFARSLAHGLGDVPMPGDAAVDVTRPSPATSGSGRRRAREVAPVLVGVVLAAAVSFAIGQFTGDRKATSHRTGMTGPATTTTLVPGTALPPPPPATTESLGAAVGARCAPPGATRATADGSTAHCANLQYTDRYLWSLAPGEIPNPVVTAPPVAPPPYEEESPVLICMQQTGHSRLRCAEEILRGNAP